MNNILLKYLIIIFLSIFWISSIDSQEESTQLTLDEVISLAREQSPEALVARHTFLSNYWQYRTYKAQYLPTLNLSSSIPGINRSRTEIKTDDGSYRPIENNESNVSMNLSLGQNIAFIGGRISLVSDLSRRDEGILSDSALYLASPVSISLRQPISAHNEMMWDKKIEPLQYERAKKEYINKLENISISAIDQFFGLLSAQISLEIAKMNYANADTLYKIAQGRHNMGTIAENDLLQMELSFLNAELTLNEASITLESAKYNLLSFLGFKENVEIKLHVPDNVPHLEIDYSKALSEAIDNNPEILQQQISLLQSDREVAKAKAEKGLNATLNASFGIDQSGYNMTDAYSNPEIRQRVDIGLDLPIIDWGQGKKNYRMAKSKQEVVRVQNEQAYADFEHNIFINVMKFNLQDKQYLIAAKSDTVAQRSYEAAKHRFLIGKIDVLDLNNALTEKDRSKQSHIQALQRYWEFYYQIRKITLYDWMKDIALKEDLERIINQ